MFLMDDQKKKCLIHNLHAAPHQVWGSAWTCPLKRKFSSGNEGQKFSPALLPSSTRMKAQKVFQKWDYSIMHLSESAFLSWPGEFYLDPKKYCFRNFLTVYVIAHRITKCEKLCGTKFRGQFFLGVISKSGGLQEILNYLFNHVIFY